MMIEGIIIIVGIALGAFALGYMFHDVLYGWEKEQFQSNKLNYPEETWQAKVKKCNHPGCTENSVSKYGVNPYCQRHLDLRRWID